MKAVWDMEWTLLGKLRNKGQHWEQKKWLEKPKDDTKQSKVNLCANRMSETKRIGSFEKGSECVGHTGFVWLLTIPKLCVVACLFFVYDRVLITYPSLVRISALWLDVRSWVKTHNLHSNIHTSTGYDWGHSLAQWFCNPSLLGWNFHTHSLHGWKYGISILVRDGYIW